MRVADDDAGEPEPTRVPLTAAGDEAEHDRGDENTTPPPKVTRPRTPTIAADEAEDARHCRGRRDVGVRRAARVLGPPERRTVAGGGASVGRSCVGVR